MIPIYKCRLCGKNFTAVDIHADFITAAENVKELANGCLSSSVPDVQALRPHSHPGGDIGLADFQGWIKEDGD